MLKISIFIFVRFFKLLFYKFYVQNYKILGNIWSILLRPFSKRQIKRVLTEDTFSVDYPFYAIL